MISDCFYYFYFCHVWRFHCLCFCFPETFCSHDCHSRKFTSQIEQCTCISLSSAQLSLPCVPMESNSFALCSTGTHLHRKVTHSLRTRPPHNAVTCTVAFKVGGYPLTLSFKTIGLIQPVSRLNVLQFCGKRQSALKAYFAICCWFCLICVQFVLNVYSIFI